MKLRGDVQHAQTSFLPAEDKAEQLPTIIPHKSTPNLSCYVAVHRAPSNNIHRLRTLRTHLLPSHRPITHLEGNLADATTVALPIMSDYVSHEQQALTEDWFYFQEMLDWAAAHDAAQDR